MIRKSPFLLISLFFVFNGFSQTKNPLIAREISEQQRWVDSIYQKMTLKEKIGQLFMVDIFSKDPKAKTDAVQKLIEDYNIGGVIFSKGGPIRQAQLNNKLQAASKIPLLVGMDAEWGLAMRLDSTYAYPWNMALGAIKDNSVVEQIGKQVGLDCKRLGVHINFAPVTDINVNPKNPIIGNRSFGEDRDNVTQKSIAFLKGMQATGVLGNAKHFPGHGDTDQDSHKTLPTLNFSRKRLDSVEMYPYKPIIDAGVESVMIAHLNVPNLVKKKGLPTSLAKDVVVDILEDSLGFQGLIFTDALNMKGAADYNSPGDIDLAAFLAGNDILLISENVPKAIEKIEKAVSKGKITEERLGRSVKKILFAKFKAGLGNYKPVDTINLVEDLNSIKNQTVHRKAVANSLTVLRNKGAILPVKDLNIKKIAYVELGDDSGEAFYNQMKRYAKIDWIKSATLSEALIKLKKYNYVIIGFHRSDENPWKSFRFSAKDMEWITAISTQNETVLDLFVSPYALLDMQNTASINGIVLSYQNSKVAQELSAQMIFGAIGATGKSPVSLGVEFPINTSYETGTLRRLQYGIPEEEGLSTPQLKKIDSLVGVGLEKNMFPGAQVLVARNGKVVYEKAFGHHTYNRKEPVELDDIFDLASLTKILATLPLVMELHSEKKLSLNDKLGELVPELKETNKADISLKEVLSHYGRLPAWIPFYLHTVDSVTGKPLKKYYRKSFSDAFNIKVADEVYLRSDYQDSIIKIIGESDLLSTQRYKYSDLSYYLIKKYIEGYYGKDLNELTQEHYYKKLGAYETGYLPLEFYDRDKIMPSENDTYFRWQRIQGYVHDMGAAMEGNIGGHAGLFSNANDVAKIMQMYLQNGYFGGKRFFSKNTMDTFNTCYYCNKKVRRGVGFDKPQLDEVGPTCGCVSFSSFGHSGFTGTYTWADPETQILYVFLSNRTFPTAENRRLISSNLRTEIQEVIQESIIN